MSEKFFNIYSDGAASGNPGPASIGVVIKEGSVTIMEISRSIGIATNNVAEYSAVIAALEEAIARNAEKVVIHTDSELMYYQLIGSYKVKNEALLSLYEKVRDLATAIKHVEIKRIPREQNPEADRLAKKAIVKQQTKVVASSFINGGEESPSSKG